MEVHFKISQANLLWTALVFFLGNSPIIPLEIPSAICLEYPFAFFQLFSVNFFGFPVGHILIPFIGNTLGNYFEISSGYSFFSIFTIFPVRILKFSVIALLTRQLCWTIPTVVFFASFLSNCFENSFRLSVNSLRIAPEMTSWVPGVILRTIF